MLENSFGMAFFLKTAHKGSKIRAVHLRITVDGITKETSTKRKWDIERWDQKTERAVCTKEDAKSLNYFLDSLTFKIHEIKTEILYTGKLTKTLNILHWIMTEGKSISHHLKKMVII